VRVLKKAIRGPVSRDLVQLARRHGYRLDELIEVIQSLG
jgi:hypothetical protein